MEQVIQLLIAGVGLVISIVVWKSSKRVARAQYHQSMQATWNQYNLAVLDNDENLLIAEWLFSDSANPPDSNPVRRKYLAILALNAIHASFLGMKDGVMDANYADQNLEMLLPILMLKEEVFHLTQFNGFHKEFSSRCTTIRNKLINGRTVIDVEGDKPATLSSK